MVGARQSMHKNAGLRYSFLYFFFNVSEKIAPPSIKNKGPKFQKKDPRRGVSRAVNLLRPKMHSLMISMADPIKNKQSKNTFHLG